MPTTSVRQHSSVSSRPKRRWTWASSSRSRARACRRNRGAPASSSASQTLSSMRFRRMASPASMARWARTRWTVCRVLGRSSTGIRSSSSACRRSSSARNRAFWGPSSSQCSGTASHQTAGGWARAGDRSPQNWPQNTTASSIQRSAAFQPAGSSPLGLPARASMLCSSREASRERLSRSSGQGSGSRTSRAPAGRGPRSIQNQSRPPVHRRESRRASPGDRTGSPDRRAGSQSSRTVRSSSRKVPAQSWEVPDRQARRRASKGGSRLLS